MITPAVKEAVVDVTQSLGCLQGVRGSETRTSLLLNLSARCIHDAERVQTVREVCEESYSSGMQLEGVQDGVI
jgi:hypothetical protein